MSLLYQNRASQKGNDKYNSFQLEDNNIYDLKKINDSMSQKIKQNQKQKALLVNQKGSNISSGLNTEKRIIYNNNYFNEDPNSGIFNKNGSQSSLSVDLNRFKINPNNFNNNYKIKDNNTRLYKNNNQMKINLEENFETFNPRKDQFVSIHSSNANMNINNINVKNNENIENSNIINNSKNKKKKVQKKQENNTYSSLLKNFNPYDIKNFLGDTNSKRKNRNKISLVNNISPSASNLQMILYNKRLENLHNQSDPEFLFKQFYQKENRRMIAEYLKVLLISKKRSSLKEIMTKENINSLVLLKPIKENSVNNTINITHLNNVDNSILTTNKNNPPFTINESPKSKYMESSSKNFLKEQNSFGLLNNFLNDMDDESKDKISLITFLSIPRILNMIISKEQKCRFVFYCSPTNISCLYGIETYIFKWNELKNFNLIGYFDLINVENCYLDNDNRKIFEIILNNNGKSNNNANNDEINGRNHYYIETEEEEVAANYVHAINFASQLVKYRIYLRKKKEKK